MPFVNCPECGKEVSAPRDLIGLMWDCPKCHKPFIVREDGADAPIHRRRKSSFPVATFSVIAVLALVAFGALAFALKRAANPPVKVIKKGDAKEDKPRAEAKGEAGDDFDRGLEERLLTIQNLFFLAILMPIYLAPSIIALLRRHNNLAPIIVVNVLLGCLFIGWVVALAWSLTDLKPHRMSGPV